jgi:hypothetical protein
MKKKIGHHKEMISGSFQDHFRVLYMIDFPVLFYFNSQEKKTLLSQKKRYSTSKINWTPQKDHFWIITGFSI